MAVLIACLRDKTPIYARQSADHPIVQGETGAQWFRCETSGTSGQPKVIQRKPETWMKSFAITAARFKVSSQDTYATLGGLGHSLTLYATIEALCLGADLYSLNAARPRQQARALNESGATILYATPTQLVLLVKGAAAAQITAFPKLRHIFSGGGRLDPVLKRRLTALFPQATVTEFFGASETSFITMSDANTPVGSVGRAYPDVQLRVGAPDEINEIWVQSPYLFDGYARGDARDTQWDGTFLSIGEMGYLNADGYLFLKGRKSRMVTVADINVFPEDIERVIGALPGVAHCAVIAVPDDSRGNKLVCFVQPDGPAPDITQMRDQCRAQLGQHCVPREIRFTAQMPFLAAGKSDLQTLRQLYGEAHV